jgi:CBS domain-containing protein
MRTGRPPEEGAMTVKSILDAKGRDVVTLGPDETLAQATALLAEKRIGAVVVTDGDRRILGILSERDIVRVIGETGASALDMRVSGVMTGKVTTCLETDTVNHVMEVMTRGRFRHLPVEKGGRLDGIVSIGDVVKRRIEEALREAEQIREYIATA